jgi:4-hydroxy-3-methylbut-2-enyl diphosphate reductase
LSQPLFLVPLGLEARAVAHAAGAANVERIGMGPVKSTAARVRLARLAAEARPLVVLGVGGGLVTGMIPGDVVVGTSVQITSQEPSIPLAYAPEVAGILRSAGLTVLEAPIISSPKIISGEDERREAAAFGAVAVDMESYWCAPLSAQHPFAVVRVLLDTPEYELFSPRIPATVLRAWKSLSRVARSLRAWSPITLNGVTLTEVGEA